MRPASTDDSGSRVSRPSSTPLGHRRPRAGLVLLATLADTACVLGLVTADAAAHPGGGLGHVVSVTWPFAVAAVVGWVGARAWRHPWRLWPTGVVVWGATWALGVLLRVLTDQGTFPTFQIVSFGFLAVTMLGWRGIVALAQILRPTGSRVSVQMEDDGVRRPR
ncbi:DUF3054 domain-containing protein [Isoptericola sp. NPDC057559]|uniref:DUF3054 domain-containing protein n=1 Tax=Isoptericola sp. NPDC057559 TaxID=3346168 RepID=UPI0036A320FF